MTKRPIYAAGLLALLALACVGASPSTGQQASPPPDLSAPLESFRAAPGSVPTPNQSFLMKQMQTTVAACMSSLIHDIANTAWWVPGVWNEPFAVLDRPNAWRVGSEVFTFKSGENGRNGATVTFTTPRWDPETSNISYGPKRIAQNVEVNNDSKTKVIRNDTGGPVHVSYDESEELTNSFSTSVTHGLTIDVTASSETTVSGSYAGVSAEEKVTTEFGVSTSSEESREESEEGTTSESISIDFDALAGQYYLVTITKEHEVTYQDFTIDGIMDFDIALDLQDQRDAANGSHYPGQHVKLMGVQGFQQFVSGYDTNHPAMVGYYTKANSRVHNGINCVLDTDRRRIVVSGTNQASLESNADYRVEGLGHTVPDDLAHLPVEDADDVGK